MLSQTAATPPENAVPALERMLRAFMTTQILHTAVRSGIVDGLQTDPADAAAIARRIGGDESSVLRLLRGLVVLGFATVDVDGRFTATPALHPLTTNAPQSMRDAALFLGGPSYRAWEELTAAVIDGACPFERALGTGLWEHMAANPEDGRAFNGAMRGLSQVVQRALAQALDVAEATVIDVGGGHGHLVAGLLAANPRARGIVVDQPRLEQEATSFLAESGLGARCRFVAADFFESVPEGGDVYLLKWIIHDWSDEDCGRLLSRCRAVMPDHGRLVIVERPLPELGELAAGLESAWPAVMADLQMLAMGGPRSFQERTDVQYATLLENSGFSLRDRLPLTAGFFAFVATPA